ncbi:LysE family translocator [Ahrensia sp. R2A130]|uniref:LysE family translocator n=1 Tax=Ahrensia sp. R2A130 TaxID=744979 RepID=UPI0001E0E05C|nr:LysE family translocator [Ahrensia sp. R2A130]EFL90359.1 lysine exporter protein LysE/YggA [Ahrensia sp. R2A130]
MIDTPSLLTFVIASIAILVVPGPTVTVIVANSLRNGTRAGLLNIAGTQAGLIILLVLLGLGLEAITQTVAWAFDWLRLIGAGYLIWLGIKLLRSNGDLGMPDVKSRSDTSYFVQGFIVILSNPKVLFFFGAFLPQFIDPAGSTFLQTMGYGLLFMVLATLLDTAYALAAGRAGSLLSRRNVRGVEIAGGSLMIGGGLWLAAQQR